VNESERRATADLRTLPCAGAGHVERCPEMLCHQRGTARGQDWLAGTPA